MKLKFILVLLTVLLLSSCNRDLKQQQSYNPPKITGKIKTDNVFSKIITDPYKNLENIKDSTNIKWYKNQTKYTQSYLSKINGRDSLIESMYGG